VISRGQRHLIGKRGVSYPDGAERFPALAGKIGHVSISFIHMYRVASSCHFQASL